MPITDNHVVALDFVLTVDNEVIDQSSADQKMFYLHGHNNIIPGLEKALEGKEIDESFSVSVDPADAYGTFNKDLVLHIPLDAFPEDQHHQIAIGAEFHGPHPLNQQAPATYKVLEVHDDHLVADANHPLVDKTLTFAVTVCGIREADDKEISTGCAKENCGPNCNC